MENKSLVTIIIPTFNREQKLPDAINSALNQTYTNIQIIIVDDGSTDNSAAIIKSFNNVEYYYQSNSGQAAARNTGLLHSKGTYIASLDSDDIWYPDFLERCIEKLEADNLDFVFANWDQDSRQGSSWDFLLNDPFLKPYMFRTKDSWVNLEYGEVRNLYLKSCPSPSSSVVLRKSSIVNGWNEEINIGDDWCLYLDIILSKECQIAFTLNKLWHKRIDEINIYDGRNWNEVLELLYIGDIETKIRKFKDQLSQEELRILQERYMLSLVELSKHKLIREFKLSQSANLLSKSFSIDTFFTLKIVPKILLVGLNRKLRSLIKSGAKPNNENHEGR